MSNNNYNNPKGVPLFHLLLSTGLGTGYVPVAPGTAGAAVALLLWWIGYCTLTVGALFWTTLVVTVAVTFLGVWTSNVMERYWGEDPRCVVIDEYVGTWIPLLVAPCGDRTWMMAILGFAAFRLIDIFKPLGCRWVDRNVKGGWGVMLDDVLAGLYALVVVALTKYFVLPLF